MAVPKVHPVDVTMTMNEKGIPSIGYDVIEYVTTDDYYINKSEPDVDDQFELCLSYYPGSDELRTFHNWYVEYHGYLAVAVCILGVVANTLTIVVLTRRSMVSATNIILAGLAISDGLTMLAYLPFALQFYVIHGTEVSPGRDSISAARFLLIYASFSVFVHTASIWMTVTLASFRYASVRMSRRSGSMVWCDMNRAKLAVGFVYLVSFIVSLPNLIAIEVRQQEFNGSAVDLWTVHFKQNTPVNQFLSSFNFWIQALLVRLVPCVLLTGSQHPPRSCHASGASQASDSQSEDPLE